MFSIKNIPFFGLMEEIMSQDKKDKKQEKKVVKKASRDNDKAAEENYKKVRRYYSLREWPEGLAGFNTTK